MTSQNRSALGLSFDYMPMTVCYRPTEESTTILTQPPCKMILAGFRSGKTNGLWSSTRRNALPFVSLIRSNPSTTYTIHGHRLEVATDYIPKPKCKQTSSQTKAEKTLPNTAKYLGIYINSKLSWNHHVDVISKKANITLWFLNRNTGHCSVKQYCYETYVRPQLEYASTMWSPYTKANIDKLEMVQQNTARYVFQDFSRYSSPTAMIKELEWMTTVAPTGSLIMPPAWPIQSVRRHFVVTRK